MKKIDKRFWSLVCLFLMVLACTKDVGLITEVEFQLLEEHTEEGFLNQGIPTTFTIVPEAELEGYEYAISYEVLQGSGYFEDAEGNRLESGRGLAIPPLTTSLLYFGTEIGEHRIKIGASDNFGMSEEIEILYNLKNVPARWQATSPVTEIELGKTVDISLLFEIVNTTLDVSYQARYEFANGSGTFVPSEGNDYTLGNSFSTITPATYGYEFTPGEAGEHQLVFVLQDSNGQELKTDIVFNVVQFIPVISIDLGEHDEIDMQVGDELECPATFTPSNATDQDITLVSSDPDVVFIDENNICIALAVGTATVTVTSTSNPDATDSVVITVTETNRVPVTAITVEQADPSADGATRQLIATVLPTNATDPSVTWSSSNTSIATVDENGLLSGLENGSVTITATSVSDPNVTGTITVEITGGALQSGTDITAFELPAQNNSTIDVINHTITVNVTEGTNLNVAPQVLTVSPEAGVSPGISIIRDFNSLVEYTVTAENGDVQVWNVNVTVSPLAGSGANDITAFELPQQNSVSIDNVNHVITVNVADGTNLNVAPSILSVSPAAIFSPSINMVQDFGGVVEYTVRAENLDEQIWTVIVTVAANQPPVASDDAIGVEQGQMVTINVIDNDSDPDTPKSELLISGVIGVQPANAGSFTVQGQQIIFTSSGDYIGVATFGYTINDGNIGNDASAVVTVTIVQTEVLITGIELQPTELILDIGQTGQLNAIVSPNNPTNPIVDWVSSNPNVATVSNTGEVIAVGQGNATITASSNDSGDVETTANVMVNPPLSSAKSIDSFTIDNVPGVISGTNIGLTLPANTDVTSLSPVISFTGQSISPASGEPTDFTNTVPYTVTAENGSTIVYSVTVTVAPSSTKSIDSFTIDDVPGVISGTNISLTLPANTDVTSLSPVISFTGQSVDPASGVPTNFTGIVPYTVTAQDGSTIVYNVTVTLAPSSAKSIDSFTIDGTLGVISGTNIGLTLPANTDVTSLSPVISFTGQSVDPASGVPTNFTNTVPYTVTAADGSTIAYNVTVTVDSPTNTAPVAQDDLFTVAEDGILFRGVFNDNGNGEDSDIDLDPLTVDLVNNNMLNVGNAVNGSAGGRFTIDAGGNLTFETNGNFDALNDGDEVRTTVTYRITDGNGGFSNTATVTVTVIGVSPMNNQPTAANFSVSVDENSSNNPISLSPHIDDIDTNDVLTTSITTDPTNGTATISNNVITYSPNTDYVGPDSITYTVQDGNGGSATATISITVTAGNNPPTAANFSVSVDENSSDNPISLSPHIDDIDSGDVLTTSITTGPTNGTATISNNVITYSPNTDYVGSDSITYTVQDGNGGSATGAISITVTAGNNPPTAANFSISVDENSSDNPISLSPHIDDIDSGDVLTTSITTGPTNGTATISNNVITYSPNTDYDGPDSITYTVQDGNGGSATGVISITVVAVSNVDPVANAGPDQTITLPTNTVNLDGSGSSDTLPGTIASYEWTVFPPGPTIVSPNSPTTEVNGLVEGQYQFTLTVTDNQGATNSDNVVVTVDRLQSAENDIERFTLSATSGNAAIDATNHTASYTGNLSVPFDTDLTVAPLNLDISANATVSPLENAVQDFSGEVAYTVTAENSDSQIWRVIVNAIPNAEIRTLRFQGEPLRIQFTGTQSSDPNGDNLTYLWDFGDGQTSQLSNPEHTYNSEGTYGVRLTVDDENGGVDQALILLELGSPDPDCPDPTDATDPDCPCGPGTPIPDCI